MNHWYKAPALATAAALTSCEVETTQIAASRCDWQTGAGCSSVPSSCHADGPLPDSSCTPGALNPDVTAAMLDQTICSAGFTRSIRPPLSYTAPLKLELMAAYGVGTDTQLFELDHLIPLELGGAPADPKNLWPEAHAPMPGSYEKDELENLLNARVCARELSLGEAQAQIAADWVTYWELAGLARK